METGLKKILLTIDVEDWFQVENFKPWISPSTWSSMDQRVEKNMHRLLDLLDSIQTATLYPMRATFFVLGWIAEQFPSLVQEMKERGHEVASHGYYHGLYTKLSAREVKDDLVKSKKCLEDITGDPIYGFRAPSFAIDNEILTIIAECGYAYDSSYNSFSMHKRYGQVNLPSKGHSGIAIPVSEPNASLSDRQSSTGNREKHAGSDGQCNDSNASGRSSAAGFTWNGVQQFYELPISNVQLARRILPWGGGAYFRLMPLPLYKLGIKHILNSTDAFLFYFHPWEIDPNQPKVKKAFWSFKFRHYTNQYKSYAKLFYFLTSFRECQFITCRDYLAETKKASTVDAAIH